jgi:hypothetical protein
MIAGGPLGKGKPLGQGAQDAVVCISAGLVAHLAAGNARISVGLANVAILGSAHHRQHEGENHRQKVGFIET